MPDYLTASEPPPDYLAPEIPFDLFMSHVFRWEQKQHLGVIGPTEQGKTNLIHHLLAQRDYAAYFAIKSEDEMLEAFCRNGWVRYKDWPPRRDRWPHKRITWAESPRRLVWPDATMFDAEDNQRRVFKAALRDIWASGRVCVIWDDFWYLSQLLNMERDAKKMLLNARSCWSPQVMAAQRAGGNRMVELVDQPTWLFWAAEHDPRNLQLVGPTGSVRRGFVDHLPQYQFLAENTRDGRKYRIRAPLLAA